ncbi:MAG: DUF3794 domain-containing protein [Clostridia bacterium]|nr:DUF3794 domain-containing protein [Clostridia bacterium]
MVLDVNKEILTLNKLICEKKETIVVQGDMIVPDSKPDILNTIGTSGLVSIYKKETMDGKVRIDGTITAFIMYLSDNSEDKARGISTNLDFSENFIIPECRSQMNPIIEAKIKSIDCKVLNGRKINIKVNLETTVKIFENEETSIINEINNNEVQMLKPSYKINTLVGEGDARASINENITIDNSDNLAEILRVNMNIVDKDIKVSYNKVLAKAEAEIQIMYLTEENNIKTVTSRLPIVGFIDIPNISEDVLCDTSFEVRNISITPNSIEEHSIHIEIDMVIICKAYSEKEINLIEDLYSTNSNLIFEKTTVDTMSNRRNIKERCSLRENINIPEVANNQIICVEVDPQILKENKMNSKIMYECEANLLIIYSDTSNMGVNTKNVKIPFEFTIDNIDIKNNSNISTSNEVISKDFVIGNGGDIGVNIDMLFDVNAYENQQLNIIDEIDEEEDSMQDYSVIVYIVKKGDTLWEIAKRFKTTVDDIVRVNGIENPDQILAGEKIYIPRTVSVNASYV